MRDPAPSSSGVILALLSALLFGVTAPLSKLLLLQDISPLLLAGLIYLGGGLGLAALRALEDGGWSATGLSRASALRLSGAMLAGCVAAPVLLLTGLAIVDAAHAALMLNLEVVFTAVLAWLSFRERVGWRAGLGLAAITLGAVLLVWPQEPHGRTLLPLLAIAGACLCWALDNNLTRRISDGDARAIALMKGLAAGLINTLAALVLGSAIPEAVQALSAVTLGALGYGLSLVLFILALRQLGTQRASAYFVTAPFLGAGLSMALYGEEGDRNFWLAALCMAFGVWLQVTQGDEPQPEEEVTLYRLAHEPAEPDPAPGTSLTP